MLFELDPCNTLTTTQDLFIYFWLGLDDFNSVTSALKVSGPVTSNERVVGRNKEK